MKNFFLKSIKAKLIVLFVLVTFASLSLVGYLAYHSATIALTRETFAKLAAVSEIKTNQIEDYFLERKGDINVLSKTPVIPEQLYKIKAFQASGEIDIAAFIKTQEYAKLAYPMDEYLRIYNEQYGYHDIVIIDIDGNIVYTVKKEVDFGTNIFNGPYKNSSLADAIKLARQTKEASFSDFKFYAPSNNEPEAFIATTIYHDKEVALGYVALQISTEQINKIMQEASGFGKTGETYIVGSDYLMRSDSRFEAESTILKKKMDTDGVRDIFSRKPMARGPGICINAIYNDYRGTPVLAHNHYMTIGTNEFAIISEVDKVEALAPVAKLRNNIFFVFIVLLIIAIIIGIVVSNSIANPIAALAKIVDKVASGDLTMSSDLKSSDETGRLASSFNIMIKSLNTIVTKTRDAVNKISSSGNEILVASQQQAAGAREQSAAVSETTSAAEELSATSEQVGISIKKVSEAATHALAGMQNIKETITKTGSMITSLGDKSQQIAKITGLIDDVADQTNLLAVNASIEAARAGEQGRGFTVVADEIRKLSDSTAKSTKDIAALIELIQHEMSNSIMSMEQSVKSVDEEAKLAYQTAEQAKGIAMSTNQQIAGSKQISDAMGNIDESMKQIATAAQQSQAAVKELTGLGSELKNLIEKFKIV